MEGWSASPWRSGQRVHGEMVSVSVEVWSTCPWRCGQHIQWDLTTCCEDPVEVSVGVYQTRLWRSNEVPPWAQGWWSCCWGPPNMAVEVWSPQPSGLGQDVPGGGGGPTVGVRRATVSVEVKLNRATNSCHHSQEPVTRHSHVTRVPCVTQGTATHGADSPCVTRGHPPGHPGHRHPLVSPGTLPPTALPPPHRLTRGHLQLSCHPGTSRTQP